MTTVDLPAQPPTDPPAQLAAAPGHAAALARLATGLDRCHDLAADGGVVAASGGWIIASASRLPDGEPAPGGWAALRVARASEPSAGPRQATFAGELVRLHQQVLAELLDAALRRLDQRTSEGAALLNRQLVRGAIADAALLLCEAGDLTGQRADDQSRWLAARALVTAGRTIVKLYGASGFAADGPGQPVYLLELLSNTYLHPGRPGDRNG